MRTLPSKKLLSGTPILGFSLSFDAIFGDPETEFPYPVVTPSAVGPALLPFACPHCGATCSELVDPKTREHYFDPERKFSWCSRAECRKRFFVDRKGAPLGESLPAGATVAPAKVDRFDVKKATPQISPPAEEIGALHMLGSC